MSARLLLVVALTAMWIALWGDASVGTAIAGLLAGMVIVFVIPRPRSDRSLAFHPLGVLRFVATFLGMLVASTWQVARLVLSREAREVRGVIVEIELSPEAYDVRTLIAHSISLTPGTLTVDVADDGRTLAVHVMEIGRVAEARAAVRALEARAIAAFAPRRPSPAPPDPVAGA